jgi:4-hydroxy-tetrahydrodipicolinate reductase
MNVALIGYGKMGKTIEKILLDRQHTIVARFDKKGITKKELLKADVAIEFSRPEAAFNNIRCCLENKVPVVVGTTGWLQHYQEAADLCKAHSSAMLFASNFSLGVNLFFTLNQKLAQLMAPFQYEVKISETHHTEKKDAPSGTAITLAEQIQAVLKNKTGWTLEEAHSPEQIPIKAFRKPELPGTHNVQYYSEIDQIEITHKAKGRKGFALGAALAAEFLAGKTGVFTMQDVLKINA